jgi:hypothetical protein
MSGILHDFSTIAGRWGELSADELVTGLMQYLGGTIAPDGAWWSIGDRNRGFIGDLGIMDV